MTGQNPLPLDQAAGTCKSSGTNSRASKKAVNQAKQGANAAQKQLIHHRQPMPRLLLRKGGAAAAGATTGTALAGPLGAVVGVIVTSKTFWKVIGGILGAIFYLCLLLRTL